VTLLLNEQSSTTASGEHPWLGIDVAGSPLGVVVTDVVPGSPAQAAGLERGDLITGIDNQPVGTVDSVSAALDGAHTGSRIEIQFSRGPVSFTTQATLGAPPAGSP
jgi:putative serine protease PepD